MDDYKNRLLKAAQKYCSARKVKLSTASLHAFNDGKVLPKIAKGNGNITMDRYSDGLLFFRVNTPRKRK